MFEGTDLLFNTKPVCSNIPYQSFKTQNLPVQNSYCDHRNFDGVNQPYLNYNKINMYHLLAGKGHIV